MLLFGRVNNALKFGGDMPKKKAVKKGKFWYIRCAYAPCGKRFMPVREHQKFCTDNHRVLDWNARHPRISASELKALHKKQR